MIYYIGTTLIAGGIGLLVAHLFKPGNGIDIDSIKTSSEYKAANIPTFGETILGLFPSNPVQALAEGNLMQIIIFSIFLGISIVLIGNKSVTLRHFLKKVHR